MKKFISSIIVVMSCFLIFGMVGVASAETAPKIFVDGSQLNTDVDPVITQGTTLVPVTVLSLGLGYNVQWDNQKKEIQIKDSKINTNIVLTMGQKIGYVNNESYEMLQAPTIIKGRTMVPLRFVTEILGFSLQWKQADKEIYLTSPVKLPEVTEPTTPAKQTAEINGVTVDMDSTIHISYTGTMNDPSTMLLTNPSRLVVDLADTGYTYELANSFIKGQTEVILDAYPSITGYRFSTFSLDPLKARFVVLLNDDASYQVVKSDTEVMIVFGDQVGEVTPTPTPTPTPPPTDPSTEPPATGNDNNSSVVYHIVIDAGHGNGDPGSINKKYGLFEKDFNLSAVLKLKTELEKNSNIVVHLTRSTDIFLELDERVAFAEKIPGVGKKADLFISIHANSFTDASANGTETYYNRANSKALAETLHPYVVAAMGLKDRGVKTAAFKVIKSTTMPAILIEAGYMSNESDVKVLFNEASQKKLATELTAGIKKYLKLK